MKYIVNNTSNESHIKHNVSLDLDISAHTESELFRLYFFDLDAWVYNLKYKPGYSTAEEYASMFETFNEIPKQGALIVETPNDNCGFEFRYYVFYTLDEAEKSLVNLSGISVPLVTRTQFLENIPPSLYRKSTAPNSNGQSGEGNFVFLLAKSILEASKLREKSYSNGVSPHYTISYAESASKACDVVGLDKLMAPVVSMLITNDWNASIAWATAIVGKNNANT